MRTEPLYRPASLCTEAGWYHVALVWLQEVFLKLISYRVSKSCRNFLRRQPAVDIQTFHHQRVSLKPLTNIFWIWHPKSITCVYHSSGPVGLYFPHHPVLNRSIMIRVSKSFVTISGVCKQLPKFVMIEDVTACHILCVTSVAKFTLSNCKCAFSCTRLVHV